MIHKFTRRHCSRLRKQNFVTRARVLGRACVALKMRLMILQCHRPRKILFANVSAMKKSSGEISDTIKRKRKCLIVDFFSLLHFCIYFNNQFFLTSLSFSAMPMSALFCIISFLLVNQVTNGQTLYPTSAGGVGAVYTMSNKPDMNQIIVNRLNASGQLTRVNAVDTNGTGVTTAAADVLLSQGSMAIFSNCLFVVNAGSNSLSMFTISPSDATQLTLLSVQPVNGWFPISVAVNSMYACVLTGGNVTGIRCFTYNSSGLYVISTFDRTLTSFLSQSIPPSGPPRTWSEILFSADNNALIVSVKGSNATAQGYLLFFPFSNNRAVLASNPVLQTPTNAILPFSMTLVGSNGLLVTDPGASGVLTMNYQSTNGTISNSMFTPINASIAGALCWSTFSSITGNYYVIGASTATIVELNLNLSSTNNPVRIVQYYPLPNNTGALETTVVTLAGVDYLYVIGTTAQVISAFQLSTAGNAVALGSFTAQPGNTTGLPKIVGIAAFIQTSSSISASPRVSSTAWMILVYVVVMIYFSVGHTK